MTRTIISIDEDDKNWLAQRAKREKVPMAEIVRRAIHRMREEEAARATFAQALQETSGIWPEGDGLHYQQALRNEWEDRR